VAAAAAAAIVLAALVVDWGQVQRAIMQKRENYDFLADAYVWYPDGRVERVTPGDGIYYQPHLNPDGTDLVIAGAAHGPPRIWRADLKTGAFTALTPADSAALHPVYSWQGDRIVFISDRDAEGPPIEVSELAHGGRPHRLRNFNVYAMDRDGSNVVRVTRGAYDDWRPAYSPDGKTIVFVSGRGGRDGLWTVPADGGAEPHLLRQEGRSYRPWYSVDGKEIFFHTIGPDPHRLMRMPATGGEAVPVLEDGVFGRVHGAWADPDGVHLLVHAGLNGHWGIWELSLDGAPPHELVPPGFDEAYHATRSHDGILAFDLPRPRLLRYGLRDAIFH
jgi:TolB protein